VSVDIDLGGSSALVIGGGGGGIGTAVVDVLARAGADVAVISFVAAHAADSVALVESLGGRAASAVLDVTDETALVSAIAELATAVGPFRYLVNVVGGALADDWHRTSEYDMDAFDRLVARNLRYAVVSCREVAHRLIELGAPGSIVNLSSAAARGTPLLAAYGASKAALESFGRTMALEWAPYGIRVNAVAPGTIKTPRAGSTDMADAAAKEIPLGRRGDPVDIANAALFLLSDMAAYITGVTLGVDGGTAMGNRAGDTLPTFVTNPVVRARFGQ
jgi:NAD(P)-dependent dehydrogenase (short-subunit alcohol dehydrogenase family)